MRLLATIACTLLLGSGASAAELRYPQFPPLPRPPRDPANAPTPARRNLGAELFFDASLSASGFTSCNNCHVFNTNWQDNLVKPRPDTSQGEDFFTLPFNTDSLLNIVYRDFFFRDGRTQDLGHAFTEPWIEDNQQLGKTPPEAAERGIALFVGKAGCVRCHVGPNFTDNGFHNISTSPPRPGGTRADEGRARITGNPADGGKFLTPTLRQVVTTSPYFHDGSALTLLDVLNHLDAGTGADPNHDAMVGAPLGLTQQDKLDLYAFLKTLRSPPTVARGPTGRLCNEAAVATLRAALPR